MTQPTKLPKRPPQILPAHSLTELEKQELTALGIDYRQGVSTDLASADPSALADINQEALESQLTEEQLAGLTEDARQAIEEAQQPDQIYDENIDGIDQQYAPSPLHMNAIGEVAGLKNLVQATQAPAPPAETPERKAYDEARARLTLVTDAIGDHYVECILTGQTFKHTYRLMGGSLQVTYTQPTPMAVRAVELALSAIRRDNPLLEGPEEQMWLNQYALLSSLHHVYTMRPGHEPQFLWNFVELGGQKPADVEKHFQNLTAKLGVTLYDYIMLNYLNHFRPLCQQLRRLIELPDFTGPRKSGSS